MQFTWKDNLDPLIQLTTIEIYFGKLTTRMNFTSKHPLNMNIGWRYTLGKAIIQDLFEAWSIGEYGSQLFKEFKMPILFGLN